MEISLNFNVPIFLGPHLLCVAAKASQPFDDEISSSFVPNILFSLLRAYPTNASYLKHEVAVPSATKTK